MHTEMPHWYSAKEGEQCMTVIVTNNLPITHKHSSRKVRLQQCKSTLSRPQPCPAPRSPAQSPSDHGPGLRQHMETPGCVFLFYKY